MLKSYRDLIVWQKAMEVVRNVYDLVKKFPKEEIYALADQMRRASVSIPSNIAEGHERDSTKEYKWFLSVANGSKAELETQLILASNIGYLTEEEIKPVLDLLDEVGKMISTIKKKLGGGR